ncbi:MAG: methyltransferase domain-containing protein [Candidatus Hodarchaeota archaeon]
MPNSKDVIKDSYAKAINKFTKKNSVQQSSCCESPSSSQKTESLQQSECCPSTESLEKVKSAIPSFGCVYALSDKANIKMGDVVVDLGSGAGHDVFRAAELVGPEGRVVGIDFTPDMISAGLQNVAEKGLINVDFRLSDIENISVLPDNFADVIISNCVINLTFDKEAVFKEAFRILKPGGRLVDADVIAASPLPSEIVNDQQAWCSCLGGALAKEVYIEKMEKAGLRNIRVKIFDKFNYLGNEFYNGILEAVKPET